MLGDVRKLFVTTPNNVLPLYLKQTFPPVIWIFNEGEGDWIESRLPFEVFSTLPTVSRKVTKIEHIFRKKCVPKIWVIKNFYSFNLKKSQGSTDSSFYWFIASFGPKSGSNKVDCGTAPTSIAVKKSYHEVLKLKPM